MKHGTENAHEMSGVTAMILVGGLGTRLRSVVSDRPKVLAEVRDRSFLSYILDQLVDVGVARVVLCCGYLGNQVRESLGDEYGELAISYSYEDSPLGTAGAIRHGLHLIETPRVLVMNGDSFCGIDLVHLYREHDRFGHMATIILVQVDDSSRYGGVILGEADRISEFVEKGKSHGPGWINAGIYLVERELISAIPVGRSVSIEREIMPDWAGCGLLYGLKSEAIFIDIGTPESYSMAEKVLPQ